MKKQSYIPRHMMASGASILHRKKVLLRQSMAFLLSACLMLANNWISHVFASDSGIPFAGYNVEALGSNASDWARIETDLENGLFTMTGAASQANAYINLSSIAASVDQGGLEINFTVDAWIGSEAEEELDSASAELHFKATEGGADLSSVTLPRGTESPGDAVTLTSQASVPIGTRFIYVYLLGTRAGTANTVQFSNPSLSIDDIIDPQLTEEHATGWTNQPVLVTLTASDADSGVEGIYNSELVKLSGESTYLFSVETNSSYQFYAQDYSGRTSQNITVEVDNIDTNAPVAPPNISLSNDGWLSSAVTMTLSEVVSASGESEEHREYKLNDGEWQTYSGSVSIDTNGETLITARTVDSAGNVSGESTASARVDMQSPAITSLTYLLNELGATVTLEADDNGGSGIVETRWASGSQNSAYFASGGTVFTGESFDVLTGGTYTVYAKDAVGNEAVDTVFINTYPVVQSIGSQAVNEDEEKEISFLVSDNETANVSLNITVTSSDTDLIPTPSVTVAENSASFTLNPVDNQFGGPVTMTIVVSDGELSTTQTFDVTVNPKNDTPVAADDVGTVDEDNSVTLDLLENDSDIDGDALTVYSVGDAGNGVAEISLDNRTIIYTPNAGFNGSDTFTYTVSDGTNQSNAAAVTVTVNEINDSPVAVNDSVTILEDASTLIDVLQNDEDEDLATTEDEALIITITGAPQHGTATPEDGQVRYVPSENWSGTDSFEYTISDRVGETSSAEVSITVNAQNDAPTFSGLEVTYGIDEDTSENAIAFQINDVETANTSLSMQVVSSNTDLVPNSGIVLEGIGDGSDITLKITPMPNAFGTSTITLKLGDGFQTAQQSFLLTVRNVNDTPVATADSYQYIEDTPLAIDMDDLIANDTDIDGDTLSFNGIISGPTAGQLVVVDEAQHTYTFNPPANHNADVTFTYSLHDGTEAVMGTVTLRGTRVNDAPTITLNEENSYQTDEDVSATNIQFTVYDVETNAAALTVTAGSSNTNLITNGNIAISGPDETGSCTMQIQPNDDQHGTATVTMTVSDGVNLTTESFSFRINSVEDAPEALNDTISLPENGTVTFNPLENDRDADGDGLTIQGFTQPEQGTVTQNGSTLTYTAAEGQTGSFSFTYTISDGDDTDTATVTVSVGAFSDPPSITHIANQFIFEDNSAGPLAFSVSDPDAEDVLTVTAHSSNSSLVPNTPENLILAHTDNNYTLTVIPTADANGEAVITLTVTDLLENSETAVFTLKVYPVNDLPSAVDDAIEVDEDGSISFDVLANDSDVETLQADLRLIAMTSPSNGYLTGANGSFTYTPYPELNGSDTFNYTLTDGEASTQGTVTITINPVNDAPTARSNWQELANSIGASAVISVLNNDYDDDAGDTVYFDSIVTPPQHGSLSGTENIDGIITYTRTEPGEGTNGTDSFTYKIRDRNPVTDEVLYSIATVYIGVDFNSEVQAYNVYRREAEDCEAFWINLSIGNPHNSVLSIEVSDPTPLTSLGEVIEIDNENKKVLFQPAANANGQDVLTYTVTDTVREQSASASISISLTPVNDLPEILSFPENQTIEEDTVAGSEATTGPLTITFDDVDSEHTAEGLIVEACAVNSDAENPVMLDSGIAITRDGGSASLTLTPIANALGMAEITVMVSDGIGYTTQGFQLSVTPVNDAPIAPNKSVELWEDTSAVVTLITPNSDVDGDALTLTIAEGNEPSQGTATINGDQTVTYEPNDNYHGTDSFTYTLDDGNGGTASGTVTLTVNSINDLPVISNLAYYHTTQEDADPNPTVTLTVTDADDDPLNYSFTSSNTALIPTDNISISGEGTNKTITLVPTANAFGSSIIRITVNDGIGSTVGEFKMTVESVNDLPQTSDDAYSLYEDLIGQSEGDNVFNVLTNDHDIDDANLTIMAVSAPTQGGSVINNGDGTLTYTPAEDFEGTDTFTYTVADSKDAHDTATVTVTVQAINDYPVAVDDTAQTNEDTAVTIDLLGNDTDVENDALSIVSISAASKAISITDNGDGTVTYTPTLNANGSDSFTYTVTDGIEGTEPDTGTVNVTIVPVNDAPDAVKNAENTGDWAFDEDTLGNFKFDVSDAETSAINLIVELSSSDQALVKDTSITYSGSGTIKTMQLRPEAQQHGIFNVSVTVSDGVNETTRTFPITINSVNDQPSITVSDAVTDEDTMVSGTATGSDIETPSGSLSFSLKEASGPTNGNVTVNANGSWQYTPDANFHGSDSFVIVVDDGSEADNSTNEASVNITVNSVNDTPVAGDDSATTAEDNAVTINVLGNDSDVDEDALEIVGMTTPHNGTAVENEDGTITYTPDDDWNGTETFDYTLSDGVRTVTATVTVTVTAVDDAPANGNDTDTVTEDTPKVLNVLANDDVDKITNNEVLTITGIVSGQEPSHGTVTIADDNQSITYSPSLNYSGSDSFQYTMQDLNGDQHGHTATFTVNLTVEEVNDQPTISAIGNQSMTEDISSGAISFTITDVEDDDASLSIETSSGDTSLFSNSAEHIAIGGVSGSNRTVTLTPNANQSGTTTITLTVRDSSDSTAETSFNVTVTAVNDAPNAQNDSGTTDDNTPITIDVLDNDDVDLHLEGDTLTLDTVSIPDGADVFGSFAIEGNQIQFTPNSVWTYTENQIQTLNYTMHDASEVTSSAQVVITITPVNDAPTIDDIGNVSIVEDIDGGTGVISFTVSDEEDDDDTLTVTCASDNQDLIPDENITLTNPTEGDGNLRTIQATPLLDQNGSAVITVTVTDSNGSTATDTFTVGVTPDNDAPSGGDDAFDVTEDTPTELDVLVNDDVDVSTNGQSITVTAIVSNPSYGTAEIIESGAKIRYTPDENNNEADSFVYTVSDGEEAADFTVTITMLPVNDAPQIHSSIGQQNIEEATATGALTFTVSDVDDALGSLTVTGTSNQTTLIPNANIVIENDDSVPDGSGRKVTVTPSGRWNGTATITLTVKDDDGAPNAEASAEERSAATATFTVVVAPVNDAPVANDDLSFVINEDYTATLNVLSNDTDEDLLTNSETEMITITEVTGVNPSAATVTIIDDGARLRFQPVANWNGTEEFTYTIQDAAGLSDTATVRVKVNAKNDNPVVVNDTAVTSEDTPVTMDVLANDSDIDSDIALNTDSSHDPTQEQITVKADGFSGVNGDVSIDENGHVVFTPTSNWNGIETFSYTAIDSAGGESVATVTVTVNGVNDDPVAVADTATTLEDGSVLIDVLANDSDVDTATDLNIESIYSAEQIRVVEDGFSGEEHGSVSIEDGKVRYTPAANWFGLETFTYTIRDVAGRTDTADVTVTVQSVNDLPTITAIDDIEINEDGQTGALSFTVHDAEDDIADLALTVSTTSSDQTLVPNDTEHIVVTGSGADRTVTVIPTEHENGATTITLTVTDSDNGSRTESFLVTVAAVNDGPTAVADSASTDEDVSATFNVLTNDTDPDLTRENDTKAIVSYTQPHNGAVSMTVDGQATYIPAADWNGTDSFTYTMKDKENSESTATVTVIVHAINDTPIAAADNVWTDEDTPVTIDVLNNDDDVDSHETLNEDTSYSYLDEQISVNPANFSGVENGAVSIDGDGKVIFTPSPNWNGTETFRYTVLDASSAESESAEVTVTVTAVNDEPTAVNDSVSTAEDIAADFNVLSNDTDIDTGYEGDTLTVVSHTEPSYGSLTIADNGAATYAPNANWNGSDSFTYVMKDRGNVEKTATVSITVNAANDNPTAVDDTIVTNEDQEVSFNVLSNDTDIDKAYEGDTLTVINHTDPSNGSLTIAGNGAATYTPTANWNGTDSFTYTLKDSGNVERMATVTVTVNAVNDGPTAENDSLTTGEDTAVDFNVLSNDTDDDANEALAVVSHTEPSYGSLTIADNGAATYAPNANWNGTDSFSYTMEDSGNAQSSAMVIIAVSGANDTPIAQNDAASTQEDHSVLIDVLANDSDVDAVAALNNDPSASPDDESISIKADGFSGAEHGAAVLEAGRVRYTPSENWHGSETITYTIMDEAGLTDTAEITVTVNAVNDPPTITEIDDVTILEDAATEALSFTVQDAEDDDAALIVMSASSNATKVPNDATHIAGITLAQADRTVIITPAENENGTVIITLTVADSEGASSSESITLRITAVNDSPTAEADTVTTAYNTAVSFNVLTNDTDSDLTRESDALTVLTHTEPSNGVLTLNENGSAQYTPNSGWYGTDTFTYTVSDQAEAQSTATVTITVNARVESNDSAVAPALTPAPTTIPPSPNTTHAPPPNKANELPTIGSQAETPQEDETNTEGEEPKPSDRPQAQPTQTQVTDTIPPRVVSYEVVYDEETGAASIQLDAFDAESGIDKVKLPGGEWIALEALSEQELQAGTYVIQIMDKAGNITECEIVVLAEAHLNERSRLPLIAAGTGIALLIILFLLLVNVRVELFMQMRDGSVKKRVKRRWKLKLKKQRDLSVKVRTSRGFVPFEGTVRISRGLTKRTRNTPIMLQVNQSVPIQIMVPKNADGRFEEDFRI